MTKERAKLAFDAPEETPPPAVDKAAIKAADKPSDYAKPHGRPLQPLPPRRRPQNRCCGEPGARRAVCINSRPGSAKTPYGRLSPTPTATT